LLLLLTLQFQYIDQPVQKLNLYFFQILFKNFSDSIFLILIPSLQNILAEVFLTGFFAPLICSQLLRIFKFSGAKYKNRFLKEVKSVQRNSYS